MFLVAGTVPAARPVAALQAHLPDTQGQSLPCLASIELQHGHCSLPDPCSTHASLWPIRDKGLVCQAFQEHREGHAVTEVLAYHVLACPHQFSTAFDNIAMS